MRPNPIWKPHPTDNTRRVLTTLSIRELLVYLCEELHLPIAEASQHITSGDKVLKPDLDAAIDSYVDDISHEPTR